MAQLTFVHCHFAAQVLLDSAKLPNRPGLLCSLGWASKEEGMSPYLTGSQFYNWSRASKYATSIMPCRPAGCY